MTRPGVIAAAFAALVIGTWGQASLADSTEAMCKLERHGETKKGGTGPCDFSQRQGYVTIDLRNGETWSLAPGKKPNHFHDQDGREVVRTATGDTHVYKWEHRRITVNFGSPGQQHGGSQHGGGQHASGGLPAMPYSTNDFDATSYFRCSLGSPSHDQRCPAGIYRGDRGSASIRIKAPNGRERVLNFDRGDVTTPDGGRLTWGKQGDEWYVGIDNREFYIVPQAAIEGG